MTTPTCLPASLTKHLPTISHPLPRQCFTSHSSQDESTTIVRLRQISSSSSSSPSSQNTSSSSNSSESKPPTTKETHSSLPGSTTLNPTSVASTGTTGTTLWLGGQLMSCYIAEVLPNGFILTPPTSTINNRDGGVDEKGSGGNGRRSKRVLELGGGVGFLS
jgi:hypothetical protein